MPKRKARPYLSPVTPAATWDSMPTETRAALLRRDPSMRRPEWNSLVERISRSAFADLSPLQREMVAGLL